MNRSKACDLIPRHGNPWFDLRSFVSSDERPALPTISQWLYSYYIRQKSRETKGPYFTAKFLTIVND